MCWYALRSELRMYLRTGRRIAPIRSTCIARRATASIAERMNPVLAMGIDEGPLDALAENCGHPCDG